MPKPITIGLLGPAETPSDTAIALLEDLTEVNDPVRVVIAASETHYTPTVDAIVAFLIENEVPFDLVTDETSDLADEVTEAAASTTKVARVAQKVVSLLERSDGDKVLTVLWDDEDDDCATAAERAIDKGIKVLDLAAGLEEIGLKPEGDEAPLPDDEAAAAAEDEDEVGPSEVEDDGLDKLKVRALRNLVEEQLGLARKVVGGMDADACRAALRAAKGTTPEPDEDEVEVQDDVDGDQQEAEREAQVERMEELREQAEDRAEDIAAGTFSEVTASSVLAPVHDGYHRELAAKLAVEYAEGRDVDPDALIRIAHRLRSFLANEQTVPGRPRKDGSPAQPRTAR